MTPGADKPVIYHCVSRAVNREFVFGDVEREQQRMYMRMYENFSGNRILSYCFMSNHFHILLEVATELAEVRKKIRAGEADESLAAAIYGRFTYRMHDLSEFMKSFTQRYTQCHNRTHRRTGACGSVLRDRPVF